MGSSAVYRWLSFKDIEEGNKSYGGKEREAGANGWRNTPI
jgi:hypothetical protein